MTLNTAIPSPADAGAEQPLSPREAPVGMVFMLGDPPHTLKTAVDSSLRLMAEHQRQGAGAVWCTLDDVMIRGRALVLAGETVRPQDTVWLRLDPAAELRYVEALRALCHVDAFIVNSPASVLTVHDKRAALALSPRPSYGVFARSGLDAALAELARAGTRRVVLKPPSLFGGRGVAVLDLAEREAVVAEFDRLLPLFGQVVVEEFIGSPTEIRVLLTQRRIIGVAERDAGTSAPGGWSPSRPCPGLSPEQQRLVGEAMALMRHHGIFLAGLDLMGDLLTEVNVSCPGAIVEINGVEPGRAETRILKDLALFRRQWG